MEKIYNSRPWWNYLEEGVRSLLEQSFVLADEVDKIDRKFSDYSFIVFPAAKAYEGFLKFAFWKKGFISSEDYYGSHFRIGKALNPQLEKKYRLKESVYDRIVFSCGGKDLADLLWDTWKQCRNLVFHWFPKESRFLSLEEAKDRIHMITRAIDKSWYECLK
jgi:hypothetical protein